MNSAERPRESARARLRAAENLCYLLIVSACDNLTIAV